MGNPRMSFHRALITGASSGIGAAFAARLAGDHVDLTLVARRRGRLEELAASLRSEHGAHVDVVVADLADPTDRREVEERIARDDELDLLINNAGFGVYGPVAESDPAVLEEMIQVNAVALTRLTRAVLPGMLTRGRGTIINVASGLAFFPSATKATYSATKSFVVMFTRALREEVQDRGVRVQALCPGVVLTEFHHRSGTDVNSFPKHGLMAPEDVVQASLVGLELGELICSPSLRDYAQVARAMEAQAALARDNMSVGGLAPRYLEA